MLSFWRLIRKRSSATLPKHPLKKFRLPTMLVTGDWLWLDHPIIANIYGLSRASFQCDWQTFLSSTIQPLFQSSRRQFIKFTNSIFGPAHQIGQKYRLSMRYKD